jgi:hypothetical protein
MYGTQYMYQYLFCYQFKNLFVLYCRSMLFDVFSIIISYLEIILYKTAKFNVLNIVGFDRLKEILLINLHKLKLMI